MSFPRVFHQVSRRYRACNVARRSLQQVSSEATRLSKQAIFSLQRGDQQEAHDLLRDAHRALVTSKRFVNKEPRLASESAWLAALEEFCEALLFERIVSAQPLFPVPPIVNQPEIIIGAVSDLVGELVRLAVRKATVGDARGVAQLHAVAEGLVAWLTSMDLTGSLRSKGDQARQHLRKLEDIRYDLAKRA